LENDKTEYTNLAYNPEYTQVRIELHKKLKKLERKKLLVNQKTFNPMKWVETNPNYQDFVYKPSIDNELEN